MGASDADGGNEAATAQVEYFNVYEMELDPCEGRDEFLGSLGKKISAYCTFSSAAQAKHEICITEVKKSLPKTWNEDWNAECSSILKFASTFGPAARQMALVPRCSALPAGVLESSFSKDEWTGRNGTYRGYGFEKNLPNFGERRGTGAYSAPKDPAK